MWCSSVCGLQVHSHVSWFIFSPLWLRYSLCSEIRIKGDGWSNLLVRKLAVIYWGQQLFPLVGFLCASKLRLHQRCKFIRQWPAKNYDSEGTGAALLSVRTHYYLTHSGGPGDWWVQHDSFPSSLFHLHSVTPILPFPSWLPAKWHNQDWEMHQRCCYEVPKNAIFHQTCS